MFKKIAFILALVACTTFAQNGPFIGTGSKAVLFSFSGLSFLGANDFDGGAGMKYYFTSPMALRFGVMVDASGTTIPANPGVGEVGIDGTTSQTTFGLEAALEYHLTTTRVSPFIGGGVQFATSSNELKTVETGTGTLTQTTTKNTNDIINGFSYKAGTSFNIFALMGVEYFIVDAVSLSAEYQLGYSILSPSDEVVSRGNVSVTTKGTSSHDFSLHSAGFLTLAVYF